MQFNHNLQSNKIVKIKLIQRKLQTYHLKSNCEHLLQKKCEHRLQKSAINFNNDRDFESQPS